MGIANLGAFAKGLASGHMTANEELRKEEDQAFQREQRTRQRKEWQDKDALDADLKGVLPEGEIPAITADETGMGPVRPAMTRTAADVLSEQAGVLSRHGKVAESAQTRGLARTERKGVREDKLTADRDAAFAEYGKMMALINGGPNGHVEFARQYGPQFNSDAVGGSQYAGHKVFFTPDFSNATHVDANGNVAGTSPWTAKEALAAAKMLHEARLAALSPEDYAAAEDRGLKRGQLAATQTTADAAMKNATTQEQYRRDQAPVLAAQAGLYNSQAGYYNRMPREGGGAGGANGVINNQLAELAQKYMQLTPEQKAGNEGKSIMQAAAILKAKLDPLSVFGENRPTRPAIGMKELNDFVTNFGAAPSNEKDNKGNPVPIGQLPPEKIRSYAEQFFYGQPSAAGGLPTSDSIRAGMKAPGVPTAPAAPTPSAGLTRNQQVQSAYDAWQKAKGPWYMPTPKGNAEVRALEDAYTRLLRGE